MKNTIWILIGSAISLTALSIASASVPSKGYVTDDTALYQNLSELKAQKVRDLNFDNDIAKLSQAESRYREKLPGMDRLRAPIRRVTTQKYRYSGGQAAGTVSSSKQAPTAPIAE